MTKENLFSYKVKILLKGHDLRTPKGFGRNYFSLTAIQATVTAITIHAVCTTTQFLSETLNFSDESLEADDPLLCLLSPLSITSENDQRSSTRTCHCNCYFKRTTRNIFISLFQKFKPKYFFPNIVSGIAPPSLSLYTNQTKTINIGKL